MKTKLNVKTLVAAAAGLAGLVVYGVTSATGYLAGSATNPLPIVCTIAALLCLAARMFAGKKLPGVVNDLLLVADFSLLFHIGCNPFAAKLCGFLGKICIISLIGAHLAVVDGNYFGYDAVEKISIM